ncbi:SpoIIE family protein phosphatase [Streptomyces sp. NPDC001220]
MTDDTQTAVDAAQAALQTAGTAIALLDAQGKVAGWTQAAQRLVGYSAAEVVGRHAAALLAVPEKQVKASVLADARSVPARWSGAADIRHRDGHRVGVHLWAQSLSGHNGQSRWIVSATDTALPASAPSDRPPNLPVGVVIRDTGLRCLWVNDAQRSRDGIPAEQRLGHRLTEAVPTTEAATLEALMRQVLESGIPAINVEFKAFIPTDVREDRTLTASFFRLDDAAGRALGVCVVSADGTHSRRARERLALLGAASQRIGTTLDVMRTGQELADLAVPLLADYATVDLADSVRLGQEPLTRTRPQSQDVPTFRRAGRAWAHSRAPAPLYAPGEALVVTPASPFDTVLRSGRSHVEPMLGSHPDRWLSRHGTAENREIGTGHSVMVIPIQARGAVLGMAVFTRTGDRVPFDQDDLFLAEELVSWAALALENARQYARERSAALALQRHLLPHRATGGSAADVAWRYLPADSQRGVGGDWFDVIPLSGARVALVVGDVVGHGITAAATMGQLRTAVRTLANLDLPCEEVLSRLDEQVIRLAETDADPQHQGAATMAATCLYAVYDPVTRQCTMARAGHPPPAIIEPNGAIRFPDLPTGAPLGVGMVPFESVTLELSEGSVLALYTDGLIESRDHDLDAGMHRLGTALTQTDLQLEELCSAVMNTLALPVPSDDATLLLARARSLGPSEVATWQLVRDPASVSRARTLVTRQLDRWGLEQLKEPTELIISELVTNAIHHAEGPVHLRLIREQFLTCEVYDTSSNLPRLRHPQGTDENGRGLLLVDELSRRWGTRHTPTGKLIWAEQHLPPSARDQ